VTFVAAPDDPSALRTLAFAIRGQIRAHFPKDHHA
jgi:hypothetical protein